MIFAASAARATLFAYQEDPEVTVVYEAAGVDMVTVEYISAVPDKLTDAPLTVEPQAGDVTRGDAGGTWSEVTMEFVDELYLPA